jgi:Fe-S-cluster containining protein
MIGRFNGKTSMDRTNGNSFAARLRRYTIHGWLRHIRLRLFGKRVVVAGSCNLCGRCCRRISLEAGGRWLRSEKEFLRLVSRYPEYSRFSLIGKDAQGFLLFTCDWYDEESRICRDHDERLEICRNYPDIDLYFTGGAIHEGCGYRFSEVVPFAKILNQELQARHGPNKAQKSAGD